MSALPKTQWTVDAYLAFDQESAEKNEFIGGDVYLMAGASTNHNIVVANIIIALGTQLRERPCIVFPSDMRVKISDLDDYAYPDVSVVCGSPEIERRQGETLLNPTLLIEVLSPSTEAHDRGRKAKDYRTISSLQEYVLISQDAPQLEHYVRQENGRWLLTERSGMDTSIELPATGCTLALADVYAKVDFELSGS